MKANRAVVLALIVLFASAAGALAAELHADNAQPSAPQNLPCRGQAKTLTALVDAFDQARAPTPAEVSGTWVLIGDFIGDTPSLNCRGVRKGPKKLEWSMTAKGYSVGIDLASVGHQRTSLEPDEKGGLSLDVDMGANSGPEFHCRLTAKKTLACLVGNRSPFGVEFRKADPRVAKQN